MVPSLVDCEPDDNDDDGDDDKDKDDYKDKDDDKDKDEDKDKDDDKDDDDHLTVQSWQESACSSFTQWSTKPFPVLNTLTNHPILKCKKNYLT